MFYRIKQFILIAADLGLLYAGLLAGVFFRNPEAFRLNLPGLIAPVSKLFILAIIISFIIGLYDVGHARNTLKFFQKIALSAAVWFGVSVFFFYAYPNVTVSPKTTLLLITLFGFGFIAVWRAFYNRFLSANLLRTPVAFVGWNAEIKELTESIGRNPERGYIISGIISSEYNDSNVKNFHTLRELVTAGNGAYPGLIVLSDKNVPAGVSSELYHAIYSQTTVMKLADFYESYFRRIPPFTFSEDWFVTNLREQTRKMYDRARILFDYSLAVLTGLIFVITFPLIALAIKMSSRGPVFFTQARVGRMGKVFKIYKYRTMKVLGSDGSAEKGGPQFASVNDERITLVGKILRRTRLDEIPQFWNILRGEMALIGPRPERPEFVKTLTEQMPFYSLRHLVKPGITGWAQLQASYFGTIEENLIKLEYDLYYVKNRNPFLDIVIVLKTFAVIFRFMGR